MRCEINKKLIYPIAKNRVVGATKISDDNYKTMVDLINLKDATINSKYDLFLWNLSTDDYIVAVDRFDNDLISGFEKEYFLFICY